MLFLAGVGCLLLEIFVLPGFAIFGLGGGLTVLPRIEPGIVGSDQL